ncbi:MAG: mechanosensitive ion channel family protein [Pseudomonadota bacterium]
MMETVLSHFEPVHWLIIAINVTFVLCSRFIFRKVLAFEESSPEFKRRLTIFRGLNVLILFLYIMYVVGLSQLEDSQQSLLFQVIKIVCIAYLSYFSMNLARFLVLRQYGQLKKNDNNKPDQYIETYEARLITLLANILIFVITLIVIIRTLGFDSLLQTGGVLGFIGVMLGLTQGSWAPDIISGLILLNSNIWDEGDVVLFSDGDDHLGVIYKTRFFHTELLSLTNNCRMMIKNSKLRDFTITNLSKFASAKGYRDSLSFKLGYSTASNDARDLFVSAFEQAEAAGLDINFVHDVEVSVNDTGDHAVEWTIFYYVKQVNKLLPLRRELKEIILDVAIERNIDLSTPITHVRSS